MKNIILLNLAILTSIIGFAQTNFKWEKVDSVAKTKAQIYSDTKMFIAEYWKSAKNVIQNDDKEGGMILVKGTTSHSFTLMFGGVIAKYNYAYTVKFLMKESRYKIIIENVIGDGVLWNTTLVTNPIEPCDSCELGKRIKTGLDKTQTTELLTALKSDLQSIVDGYDTYIKKPSVTKDDW